MDDEFYRIFSVFSWHKSGLVKIDIDDLPFSWALGLKYLVDITNVEEKRII